MVLVSVVMPIGRVDQDLVLQFEALDSQSYSGPWELVLSLNTNEEDEIEKLNKLVDKIDKPTVKVVDSSQVRSASYARNIGVKNSQGEFLIFCDGDDIADSDWLSEIVGFLQENPQKAVGGQLGEDVLAIPGQESWRPPATPGALPRFLDHPYLVSANMGLSRESFEKAGGFDEDLIRCEDIAFSWELINLNIDIEYLDSAIIHYRHRKGLKNLLKQHYMYGRGFSQLLSRFGTPGSSENISTINKFKPNGQKVASKNTVYFLRRGAIALGRIVGLVEQRFKK